MMNPESLPPHFDNITIFETEDGKTRVEVRFEHDNVWLTQKLMAELYECSADNISLHLKHVFADKELNESSVTEDSSVTAADGKKYRTKLYSLEVIIAVGYRVHWRRPNMPCSVLSKTVVMSQTLIASSKICQLKSPRPRHRS